MLLSRLLPQPLPVQQRLPRQNLPFCFFSGPTTNSSAWLLSKPLQYCRQFPSGSAIARASEPAAASPSSILRIFARGRPLPLLPVSKRRVFKQAKHCSRRHFRSLKLGHHRDTLDSFVSQLWALLPSPFRWRHSAPLLIPISQLLIPEYVHPSSLCPRQLRGKLKRHLFKRETAFRTLHSAYASLERNFCFPPLFQRDSA